MARQQTNTHHGNQSTNHISHYIIINQSNRSLPHVACSMTFRDCRAVDLLVSGIRSQEVEEEHFVRFVHFSTEITHITDAVFYFSTVRQFQPLRKIFLY